MLAIDFNALSSSFKTVMMWDCKKLFASTCLILFFDRSSSRNYLNFSRCSIFTISFPDAFRILNSFSGLYCNPYRYCSELLLTSSSSKDGIPKSPLLKFLSSGEGFKKRVITRFYFSRSTLRLGRKPKHRMLLMKLPVRFRSRRFGILELSNMSSKSLSFELLKSRSLMSLSFLLLSLV